MATVTKRQRPQAGDFFAIEVGDGHSSFGQVLELVTKAMGSVAVALWAPQPNADYRQPGPDERPLAVLLSTPDHLERGVWQVRGNVEPIVPVELRPYEKFRSAGWVGARIHGSAIVREFLEASIGLKPWDDWADPRFLDGLLYPGQPRPARAVFKPSS